MIHLSREAEALAKQLAAARGVSIDEAVKLALEESARAAGLTRFRRRLSADEMLAVGEEIAAMPLLDSRAPQKIMDDINAI